jgi:metal-responsive CopG/Arc/MetJ family transcriptional regulator
MQEKFTQVNVNFTDDDVQAVDVMMVDDGFDNRSAFFRKLVRMEKARRYSQPNPVITVEEALAHTSENC